MSNLVLVYGSLRQGFGNNIVLGSSKKVGECTVNGYKMFSYGPFPFIQHGDGCIVGEVYEVNAGVMEALDHLEGYPSFYDREQVTTDYGDAWVYFIDSEDDGHEQVQSGDWKQYTSKRTKHGAYR